MFKKTLISFVISSTLSIVSIASTANDDIIKNLSPFFGKISQQDITQTPLNGVSEVVLHSPIDSIFVSNDGKYLIQGDIISLETRSRLKPSSRINTLKKVLIDTIADKDKIIFKAKDEKYIVHVFTDVDCPFCKKLHAQMPKMNALGITVKYLAAPLASLHPTAQGKMEKIWCAKDPVKAMHDYKTNGTIPNAKDCLNPVAEQLSISQQLGVKGTPAIFLTDGTHLPGYMPANKLLQRIKQKLGK
ncbi:MAG: DsbC family protein [Gammaproteobacteria bacterium]|uniref:Thiol:disulfide interchange protein DsbC n=1 Tax=hydrothermal vent metagenome TaxID=652676 RepID=A0A1W1E4F3_9ZZZZ|nr:DsbC family protein [Gammaproteobacteria bacterium]